MLFDDCSFFEKLFLILPKLDTGYLIVGGDFNLVLDVIMNRSSSNPQTESIWNLRCLEVSSKQSLPPSFQRHMNRLFST